MELVCFAMVEPLQNCAFLRVVGKVRAKVLGFVCGKVRGKVRGVVRRMVMGFCASLWFG
jgi:hypothetical protein